MKLGKKYLLNYVISAMFIVVAIVFFYNLSLKVFGFDLLKVKDIYRLFRMLFNGKIFVNLRSFSVFISFVGFVFVIVGGFKLSMDIEYKNDETESLNNENAEKDFDIASQKLEVKDIEKTDENVKNDIKEPEKQENKFAIYDVPKEKKELEVVNESVAEVINNIEKEKPVVIDNEPKKMDEVESKKDGSEFKIDENAEREKLKNKIKEMISDMEEKEKVEVKIDKEQSVEQSPEKLLSKFDMSKVKGKENTIKQDDKKGEILTAEKVVDSMNYKKITEEQNMIFENILIDAGFKLLSEIRIGETGIDYLGISKEQIAIIQVDTESGKWMANEELIGDNKYPLWYSETGNKISPFYRTTESVNTIKSLFKDIDIPVNGYVCLTDNTIVNMDEAEEMARKQNLKILKVTDFEGNEFVDSLDEKFATESVTEPDQKTLNKMIEILEKAEMPE